MKYSVSHPLHQFLQQKAKSLAAVWTLLIFLACFIPGNEFSKVPVPLNDKIAHFILFAGFSFLWCLAMRVSSWKDYFFVFVAGSLFGLMVEVVQGQLAFLGRTNDPVDTLADIIGSLIGLGIYKLYAIFFMHKTN